jgi:hypothetical protein
MEQDIEYNFTDKDSSNHREESLDSTDIPKFQSGDTANKELSTQEDELHFNLKYKQSTMNENDDNSTLKVRGSKKVQKSENDKT